MIKKVPFNDLSRIHKPIENKILKDFNKLVNESDFILGKDIQEFENNFSVYTNSKFTISCANGTDAIELILRSLNIGPGDEVLVPTNSFIATALAVTRSGALPIFVDCDEFFLIDSESIEKHINRNTRAIIAVNLYGQLANLDLLSKISKHYKLYLIEDSAQSHGAKSSTLNKSKSIASAYSFYPGKNLGAWGDGGAITTDSYSLYKKLLLMRNVGSVKKYNHKIIGFNSRLQPLQGLVLKEKLKNLNLWNELRNEIANLYLSNLKSKESIILPKIFNDNYHVWHLFVIRTKNRNRIFKEINLHNIEFGIHYPKPIHRQLAYKNHKQYNFSFTNADRFSKELLSLPIFPLMKQEEVDRVIDVIMKYA